VSFFRELRRRKVFRFGGIYIVGAWLVFQVADVFFPAWGVPDAALRYLLYAAIACFPIALVFSWFYDVSTGGISRTPPAGVGEIVDTGLKRSDYLVLAGLLVVAGAILYDSLGRVVDSAGEAAGKVTAEAVATKTVKEKPPNSIAVLPFDNLDPNLDTGYFSDGVSAEILHRLSATRALKVIGRTSSFPFGGADMGLDRISDILGVRYLLGGSVRRSGDRVRLTARMVDEGGYQVWSASFDGELKDIFTLQDEIAEQVASQITRQVVVLESPEPARRTESAEAYSQYLLGQKYFHDRSPGFANKARDAHRKAIEADPDYAPPYAGLAIAAHYGADIDETLDRRSYVRELVDRALELDPNLAEGWFALSLFESSGPAPDREQTIAYLQRAIEFEPSFGMAYNSLAIELYEAGRPDESRATSEQGLAVDPLNPVMVMNHAQVLLAKDDFAAWHRRMSTLLDLPDPPIFVYWRVAATLHHRGRLAEALSFVKQGTLAAWRAGMATDDLLMWLAGIYEHLGMREAADYWAGQLIDQFGEINDSPKVVQLLLAQRRGQLDPATITRAWLRDHFTLTPELAEGKISAMLLIANGHYADGIELLEPLLDHAERPRPRHLWPRMRDAHWLAYAYLQAGQGEDADRVFDWSAQAAEVANDMTEYRTSPPRLMIPALDRAARGDLAGAAELVLKAVDAGWRGYSLHLFHDVNYLDYDHFWKSPIWRGAWQSEEFAPILADIQADLARQRAEVEAIEAEHDFRAEFEALVAVRGN
jgi:TolB-like protein